MLPDHLGGHMNKTHVDMGALSYLKNTFDVKSMLDVGCGPGGMVYAAKSLGIYAIGIDGDYTLPQFNNTNDLESLLFILHDYTKGTTKTLNSVVCDLVWSVEFLEHIEERFLNNVMPTFQLGKVVVVTAAPPGWAGHHHVNCQDQEYWIEKFKDYGLAYSRGTTAAVCDMSTMVKPFLKQNGMVFFNERI